MDQMLEHPRIACVSSADPRRHPKNGMAQALDHMVRSLQRAGCEVTIVGPLDAPFERAVGKAMDVGCRLALRRRYMHVHSTLVARRIGHEASRRIARDARRYDVILSGNAMDVAYLRTELPVILSLDATVAGLRGFYPLYSTLVPWSINGLLAAEGAAIRHATRALFSSAWAAHSAIEDYGADPAKVHVIPFAANMEDPPPASILARRVPVSERGNRCRLLFLSVDWARKGGDIALETLMALDALGIEAELVVCGCTPPAGVSHPRLRVVPFLNKRIPQERAEFETLMLESDFLLLPTRGDITPAVIGEANAFGLPVLATDIGGIGGMIVDGETGFLLPFEARGDAYAAVIAQTLADPTRLAALPQQARQRFDERLNWDAWARAALPIIREVAGQPRTRPATRDATITPSLHGEARAHAGT